MDGTIYAGFGGLWGAELTNHVPQRHGERRSMQQRLLQLYVAYVSRFSQRRPRLTVQPNGTVTLEEDRGAGRATVVHCTCCEEGVQKLEEALKGQEQTPV